MSSYLTLLTEHKTIEGKRYYYVLESHTLPDEFGEIEVCEAIKILSDPKYKNGILITDYCYNEVLVRRLETDKERESRLKQSREAKKKKISMKLKKIQTIEKELKNLGWSNKNEK